MPVLYHWKHGWIPLDHVAALSKAKGNHAAALKMLSDTHAHDAGIHSREHVAKAALDLPNVHPSDRRDAHRQLTEAAAKHGAGDLVPRQTPPMKKAAAKPAPAASSAGTGAGNSRVEHRRAVRETLKANGVEFKTANVASKTGGVVVHLDNANDAPRAAALFPGSKPIDGFPDHIVVPLGGSKRDAPASSTSAGVGHEARPGDRVVMSKSSGAAAWYVVRKNPDGTLMVRSLGGRTNYNGTAPTKTIPAGDVHRVLRGSGTDWKIIAGTDPNKPAKPAAAKPASSTKTPAIASSSSNEAWRYANGLSDTELEEARGRQLSARVRKAVEAEHTARAGRAKPASSTGRIGPTDAEKVRNAETMHGTGSKQHQAAQAKFGAAKPASTPTTSSKSYDTKSYERGWKASQGGSSSALERADLRGEPKEWHDGYLDHAVDRPKHFSRDHTPAEREAYDRGELKPNAHEAQQARADAERAAQEGAAGKPRRNLPGGGSYPTKPDGSPDYGAMSAEQAATIRAKRAGRGVGDHVSTDRGPGTVKSVSSRGTTIEPDAPGESAFHVAAGTPGHDRITSLKADDELRYQARKHGTIDTSSTGRATAHAEVRKADERAQQRAAERGDFTNVGGVELARQASQTGDSRLAHLAQAEQRRRGDEIRKAPRRPVGTPVVADGKPGTVVGHATTGHVTVRHPDSRVQNYHPDKVTDAKAAGGSGGVHAHPSINGKGWTDYTLPSGHKITVKNDTGRVDGEYVRNAAGVAPIDAHPELFQHKSVGRSMQHDDHNLFKPHLAEQSKQADDTIRGAARKPGGSKRTSSELTAAAEAKRTEAARIAGNAGTGDRAAGRLSPRGLAQAHRNTDSSLRRYTEASNAARDLEFKAGLQAGREREAARVRFDPEHVKGATHVQTDTGWHEVVRVNAKSVTVKTPYSWTDSIKHEKIHKVAKPGADGKSKIMGPDEAARAGGLGPDSNPMQRDPAATSRPSLPSAGEVERAQSRANATTAFTMSSLSDESLDANIAKYQSSAPGSSTLKVLRAEQTRRLRAADDDTLTTKLGDLSADGDFGPRFEAIAAELDRRDGAVSTPVAPESERDALMRMLHGDLFVDNPDAWRAQQAALRGGKRRDPEKELRNDYDAWVHTQWLRAEEETRGNMLSKRAQHEGVDVTRLFNRDLKDLRKYASPELQEWFAQPGNGRMSFPEFRAGARDDARARAARRRHHGFESEYG